MRKPEVVMKKLITGIVTVFLLQVGFIAYNAADRAGYLVSDIPNQVEPIFQSYSPVVSEMLEPDDVDSYGAVLPDEGPNTLDDIGPMVAERRQVNPHLDRRPLKVVAKGPLFQPVVITIPEQTPVEFKFKNEYAAVLPKAPAQNYDISSAEAPRPENKSGLSKAIRKPFEWLKALGSKVKDIR